MWCHIITLPVFFIARYNHNQGLKKMLESAIPDANTDTTSIESPGSSPETELTTITDDEGLVSTTEFQAVEPVEGNEDTTDTSSDAAEQNTAKDKSSDTPPFHEHPRFKEIIESNNALKKELSELKGNFEKKDTAPAKQEYQIDWSNEEKIVEAITENPKLFITEMFQQFREESSRLDNEKNQKLTYEQKRSAEESRVTKYFTENEGALDLWKDGSITKYMDENPGETAISAHKALTEESRVEKLIADAKEKAKNEYIKELKSKGSAASLSNGSSPPTTIVNSDDEMLKNPEKYGGTKNVLVNRLKKLMAS